MACDTPQHVHFMHCAFELQPVNTKDQRVFPFEYTENDRMNKLATYPSGFNGINRRHINSNAQRNNTEIELSIGHRTNNCKVPMRN